MDIGGLRSRTPERELPPGGHIEKVLTPARTPLPIEFTPLQLIRARHAIVPFQEGPDGLVWFCGPGVLRVVGCY